MSGPQPGDALDWIRRWQLREALRAIGPYHMADALRWALRDIVDPSMADEALVNAVRSVVQVPAVRRSLEAAGWKAP